MRFHADPGAVTVFRVELEHDVTSELVDARPGQKFVFVITQPAEGGKLFAFPPNFKGLHVVDLAPGALTVAAFTFDGTEAHPLSGGQS